MERCQHHFVRTNFRGILLMSFAETLNSKYKFKIEDLTWNMVPIHPIHLRSSFVWSVFDPTLFNIYQTEVALSTLKVQFTPGR